ncbi:MAG: transposase [Saprospiraceae bacterium]|nr:transposase [Saprospiraceae bacterium]
MSNFLKREKFTPRQLWQTVERHIMNRPDGFLIADDSVQDKRYSKFIELVKKQYSGNEHGLVRGIGIVNLVHTSGEKDDFFPIDYRIYDNLTDGKTKNEHFREMFIAAVANKSLLCRTILFDSWYSSVDNLKLIHRCDWTFFTTLKSNRMVSISKETGYVHLQAIEWTEQDLKTGIPVKLKEVPFLVQLFKIVATNGDIEWVITNDLACTDAHIVEKKSGVRWQVEQFHREVKQLTGSEKCQCRSARAQRNHIACCYHAWLSMKIQAKNAQMSVYRLQKELLKPFLIQIIANPKVVALI